MLMLYDMLGSRAGGLDPGLDQRLDQGCLWWAWLRRWTSAPEPWSNARVASQRRSRVPGETESLCWESTSSCACCYHPVRIDGLTYNESRTAARLSTSVL